MHISLVMASPINGKITRGSDPYIYKWTSCEDQEQFRELLAQANCIVMGRKTYDVAKTIINPQKDKLRIIFTKTPEKFKNESIPHQVEFTSDSPLELISKLEVRGVTKILLVAGAEISGLFLKEKLIDRLILTLEPKIFGEGKNMFTPFSSDVDLILKSFKKLNLQGTLLLEYDIVRN